MRQVLNILIVDDEQNSRELLQNLLLKYFDMPFITEEATNNIVAEKLMNQMDYDIIFSDSKMPFENGNELIKPNKNKKSQFVLCTAFGNEKFKNKFDFPVYFLQKPIDFEDFKMICKMITDQLNAIENTLII